MLHTKARALFLAALVIGVSGVATAKPPATGLGQAWPNAPDVSVSPHYHAYVFALNGVRYIQVNALDGRVLGAVGTAVGQFIVLPIGNAAQVSTPEQTATNSATPVDAPAQIYNDGTTTISATPMSDGTTQLKATPALEQDCDAVSCSTHGA